jgi:archaellum component FlaC
MTKEKILEKLKDLRKEIKDYSNYLENMTYHPYSTVDKFANELKLIINEIEEDL